jgi:hypothetical protein
LDFKGSGTKSTEKFTVASDWDLQWSYDCMAGLTRDGVIPAAYHSSFIVSVKRFDGNLTMNQRVNQLGVKDQGVQHYHASGIYYLEVQTCCVDSSWSVKVTG